MKNILFILISIYSLCAHAQKQKGKAVTVVNTGFGSNDSTYFSSTKYRLIGPFRGGRSAAVAGSFKNENTFYFGATGGGIWKTNDGGSNWKNISDKFFGGSIGAVAIAPSDENIMYVGEGENTMRGNVSEGLNGIWKSNNGGRTWINIGLKDTRHIVKIVIHPKNPDIVWAAVAGHLFGTSDERGVYKTTDGGITWKKVLFANNQAGAIDLVMEPENPQTLYATTWRVIRTPYSLESGGEGSALWKSTDGGETWTNLMNKKGLPGKETIGIIGVTVSASNPEKIYAIIECKSKGLYRSDDGGETWNKQTDNANICQRSWYFSKIFCDPKNENVVYALNVGLYRSEDGGKTFQSINTPHGDHHDLWIDPKNSNRMIVGDDGGAQISFDRGANWSTYMNQPTTQIYRVTTDNSFPYRILGAQQDNSTLRIKSRTYGAAITEQDWEPTAGAESGYVVPDPMNNDIVYGGNYLGYLSRYNHKTGENRAISVWPDNTLGDGAIAAKYRFQWNFPIFFSPHNPKKLYAAGNVLFATENEGQSWKALSGDLTTNDKTKQQSSGGIITKDNTSVEYYCTIFTAAESVTEKDILWTGSDDGLVHVSKDAGKTWTNVTPPDAPKFMMWNCIETSPFNNGEIYIVGTKYKMDDFTPYIYKTTDYGKSWQLITNNIPENHFARCIRADKKRKGLLYAGTEYGMYISYDNGNNWKPFQLNMPIVPITDLTIKENDLIVATQGRSFWVLDDLTVVQQKAESITQKGFHVFDVNDAYRMEGIQNLNVKNAGFNPPNGSIINYWLKEINDSTKVAISIFDKQKKVINTFSNDAKEESNKLTISKGMNQFVWDMKYTPAEKLDGLILWNGNVGGPKAAPGKYTARIKTDKDSIDVVFNIKADPNYTMTEAEYDEQVTFLLQIRDKFGDIQKSIKNIRSIRNQLNDFTNKMDTLNNKEIMQLSDSIKTKLTSIEEALYQTKAKSGQDVLNYPIRLNDKISGLYDYVNSGYCPVAKQAKEAFADLSAQADIQLIKLNEIMKIQLQTLNKLIHEKQIPVIGIKK